MKSKELSKIVDTTIENVIKEEVEKSVTNMKKPVKKQAIKLNESDLLSIVEKVISEQDHPGVKAYKKHHKDSGKINKDHSNEVDKKIKKALDYKGNDNPEFPHAHGGEKKVDKNTDEQNEFIEDFKGFGQEDLNYQQDPKKEFKDRFKGMLQGDQKLGNEVKDRGNVIPTKTGENMYKKVKRKREKLDNRPMYKKDEQPTGSSKQKNEDPKKSTAVNESDSKVEEAMNEMKKLYNYKYKS